MRYVLFTAMCCMVFLLALQIRKVSKGKSVVHKSIVRLLVVAVLTVLTQGIFMICGSEIIGTVALGLYYACIDWLVISLLSYIEVYAETFKSTKFVRRSFYIVAVLDSMNLISNVFFHHVFSLSYVLSADHGVVTYINNDTLSFQFHLVFSYVIILFCIISLVDKIIKVPALYRWRFGIILVLLVLVVGLNAVSMVLELVYDFSVLLYCIFGILLCHYSLYYTPKILIDRTLSYVANEMKDALFCFDIWGNCVFVNKMVEETFRVNNVIAQIEGAFKTRFGKEGEDNPEEEEYEETISVQGSLRTYRIVYRKMYDKKNNYIGGFYTMRDRTMEIEQYRQERYNGTHDKLTGLYNREYFFETVEKLLQKYPEKEYVMVCSDIKGFKLFNELFGTKVGDKVLRLEADLLKRDAGSDTVYGRIAGDEFAILVPATRFEMEVFIRNIQQMRQEFSSHQYQLHIYVGVYRISNREEPISVMCDKAKLAIESHRDDYNAIITLYDNKLLDKSLYERKIVGEFDRALERKEFVMFLQPQIDANGRILGAEALVRWQHPERGLVMPGDFIEVFEKTGLIYRLDRYMWEEAVMQLKKWKLLGRDNLHISVNISARDFYYIDIYKEVTKLVEKHGVSPKNLKLEITETVLMTEMKDRLELLERLRNYGFQLEMDDFGSGYSSLNMLKNIDVDVVKIDMGFLDETERMERGTSILNSIIHLIKNLGMGVITEGVETKEQVDSLLNMGCDMFQGYYFAKPMPVDVFEEKYWQG